VIHKILYHLIPFLLPFIAYGLYVFATRRARAQEQKEGRAFDEAPWFWLFATGLAFLVASLIAVWFFTGDPAGGSYVAPHVEDGKIVPGKFN